MNQALRTQLPRSFRQHLNGRPYDVAIDLVEVSYYGKPHRHTQLEKSFSRVEVFCALRRHRIPYVVPVPLRGQGLQARCQGQRSYQTRDTFNSVVCDEAIPNSAEIASPLRGSQHLHLRLVQV